jgi:hypothetical protein
MRFVPFGIDGRGGATHPDIRAFASQNGPEFADLHGDKFN